MQKLAVDKGLPFSFSTLYAFYFVLLLENRKEIDIEALVKYNKNIEKRVMDVRKNSVRGLLFSNLYVLNNFDVNKEVEKFIKSYGKYFYIEDNKIKLKDEYNIDDVIDLKALEEEKEELADWWPFIQELNNDERDILSIKTIIGELRELKEDEDTLEDYYFQLVKGQDIEKNKEHIKKMLLKRNDFFGRIYTKGAEELRKYEMEATGLIEDEIEFPECPIDLDLCDDDEIDFDVSVFFYNMYHYAIFDERLLSSYKIANDINAMYDGLILEFKQDYIPRDEENVLYPVYIPTQNLEMTFWLLYTKKIDEFMKKYGEDEELQRAKARILYAFDDISLSLFDEDKLNDVLDDNLMAVQEEESIKEAYEFWQKEALFFIKDVFEGKYEYTEDILYKKLIFVSTYYDLTEDIEIVNMLDSYQEDPRYQMYKKIILGDTPTLVCTNNIVPFIKK